MIRLVIFDLDGVIVSTTEAHFHAWANLFKRHFQIELDPELETLTRGVSRIDSLNVLANAYHLVLDQSRLNELAFEKNNEYKELIADYDESRLFVGVKQVFDYLKLKGIKIALGSASKNGPTLLNALGIEDYFDYIVNPENLRSKPAPDIFEDAMNYFGFLPEECLGIEDSVAGIQSIKDANMRALGIGLEDLYLADRQVKDFSELEIKDWEELLN